MSNPKDKPRFSKAFEWSLSLLLIFGCLVIGVPLFIKARSVTAVNACVNNLHQIDAAANQFALNHNLTNGSPINFPNDLTPYINPHSAGKIPKCPQGGTYSIKRVGETPTCSLGTNIIPGHYLP